ncbi:hypothetical protein C8R47DRAFT_1315318 [Mycena vitilis]|nr:hypothetical protein C8R47DRAFT_1315318 [Mycena vitilis]
MDDGWRFDGSIGSELGRRLKLLSPLDALATGHLRHRLAPLRSPQNVNDGGTGRLSVCVVIPSGVAAIRRRGRMGGFKSPNWLTRPEWQLRTAVPRLPSASVTERALGFPEPGVDDAAAVEDVLICFVPLWGCKHFGASAFSHALILLRAVWRPPLPAYAPFGSCLCDVGQPAPALSGRRVGLTPEDRQWRPKTVILGVGSQPSCTLVVGPQAQDFGRPIAR